MKKFKISMDNLAIKLDYFSYLNEKLNKGFKVGNTNDTIKKELINQNTTIDVLETKENKNEELKQEEGE